MREGSCSSEPVLLTISAAEQHFVSCRAGLRSHHKIQRLGKVSPETAANRKNVLLGIKPPKICYAVFDLNRKFCLSFHFPHPSFRPALHPTPTSRRNSFNRGGDRQHLLHLTAHGQHCVRRAGPRGPAAQLSSALPATPRPQGLRLRGLCCPRHAASVARGLGVRPPSVGFAKLPTTLPLKQNPPALCPAGDECVTWPRGSHAVTPVQEATLEWLWLCQLPEALVSFHGFQDAQLSSVPIQLFKFCFP